MNGWDGENKIKYKQDLQKSKSKEAQAQVLILQALGHTCGATYFKTSKGSRNGRSEQELFQPAPWAAEGLRPGSKKKSWKNLTRQELVHIATRGGRDKNKRKALDRRVDLAWSWITAAKKDDLRSVPQMYRLLNLAPTFEMPSSALLRAQMVERLNCLTLQSGLYVAPSSIPGGGYGLFTSVLILKGRTVTYYDGVAFVLNKQDWEKHKERLGWYKAIGLTSKNCASIAGFTSMDKLPASAGVVSLMNSLSPPQANCKEGYVENKIRPLLVIDGSSVFRVPTVMAARDIEPGTELFWDYAVSEHGLGDHAVFEQAVRCAVVKLLLLGHRFDKGCPLRALDPDVLQKILSAVLS